VVHTSALVMPDEALDDELLGADRRAALTLADE
jgi:hypothetical protein